MVEPTNAQTYEILKFEETFSDPESLVPDDELGSLKLIAESKC
jgi:hypothetical protein